VKERKTEINIETYEVMAISRDGSLSRVWCAICSKQVVTISLGDAWLSALGTEAAQREMEAGRIHLIETVGGSALICLNSLIQI